MPQSLPDMFARGRDGKARRTRPEQSLARTRRRSTVALSGVPLFTGFSKRHLQHLADASDEVLFPAGAAIVEDGTVFYAGLSQQLVPYRSGYTAWAAELEPWLERLAQ